MVQKTDPPKGAGRTRSVAKTQTLSAIILDRLAEKPDWQDLVEQLCSPVYFNVGTFFDMPETHGRRGYADPEKTADLIEKQMVLQIDMKPPERSLRTFLGQPTNPYGGPLYRTSSQNFFKMLGDKLWDSHDNEIPEQDVVAMWMCAIHQTCCGRGNSLWPTNQAFHHAKKSFRDTPERSHISILEHPCANTVELDDQDAFEHFGPVAERARLSSMRDAKLSKSDINVCLDWIAEAVHRSIRSFVAEGLRYVVIGNIDPNDDTLEQSTRFQEALAIQRQWEAEQPERDAKDKAERLAKEDAAVAEQEQQEETRLSRVGEDYRDGLTPNSIPWKDMTPEKMGKLIWEHPATSLGVLCGVSDVAIHKYCKRNDIERPGRGYWLKDDRDKPRRSPQASSGPSM